MADALDTKLGRWVDLSDDDRAIPAGLGASAAKVARHHHPIRQGDDREGVFLLLEGWAMRHKTLADGHCQIVGVLLPGDLRDVHVFILDRMDRGITTVADAIVAKIPKAAMTRLMDERPAISRALLWTTPVDERVLREWLVNIGGRGAYARLAHLFRELYIRLDNVGLVDGDSYVMPLTQEQIADALGLTAVHVNRTMRLLREAGPIRLSKKVLTVLDFGELKRVADFDHAYLHARSARRATT